MDSEIVLSGEYRQKSTRSEQKETSLSESHIDPSEQNKSYDWIQSSRLDQSYRDAIESKKKALKRRRIMCSRTILVRFGSVACAFRALDRRNTRE
jgi:hypothetical protein